MTILVCAIITDTARAFGSFERGDFRPPMPASRVWRIESQPLRRPQRHGHEPVNDPKLEPNGRLEALPDHRALSRQPGLSGRQAAI